GADAGILGEVPGEAGPGGEELDGQAVLATLGSGAGGEVDDGRFSGRVVEEGPSRDMPADAGGVDDASRAPRHHDRGGVLHAGDGAADMHRDRVVEPLQVEHRDPTRCAAVTGSVEETVESAVTLDGQ